MSDAHPSHILITRADPSIASLPILLICGSLFEAFRQPVQTYTFVKQLRHTRAPAPASILARCSARFGRVMADAAVAC